jgi:AcrR family transcriptional regulator
MGLREMKVARTRAQIVEVALDLFLERGYDSTTMEQIAESAEIGTSTLYRYFPSKDLLLLEPFTQILELGHLLKVRPASEPLGEALGAVIRGAFPGDAMDRGRFAALAGLVDRAPGPRARLWDLVNQAIHNFHEPIAARLGLPVDDPAVALASRTVYSVFEIASQSWSTTDRSRASWDLVVEQTLAAIAKSVFVLPE